jgi:hypothetical protein
MRATNKKISSFDLAKHVLTMDVLGIEKSERLNYIASHADVDISDNGREISTAAHSFVQVDAIFAALLSKSSLVKDKSSVIEHVKDLSFTVSNILHKNNEAILQYTSLPIRRLYSIYKDDYLDSHTSIITLVNNAGKDHSLKSALSEIEDAFRIEPSKKGPYDFYREAMNNAIGLMSETLII